MPQAGMVPSPVPDGLPIGTTLQRYVLLERVGQGAMGAVYAAYDYGLDRKVAVKLLREPRHGSSQRRRLMREAQALAKLSHPNVVAIHDIGSHDDQVFIAMEFVDGSTLRRWRDVQPRSLRDILAVFRAAGEGLAAAHAAGIVHRDFKPDNVLIDRHGRARVGDFGLATAAHDPFEEASTNELIDTVDATSATSATGATGATESSGVDEVSIASGTPIPRERPEGSPDELFGGLPLTRTGMIFGTPAYMALEQHHGKRANDPRTDQFSFAVALYESVCGVHPFAAPTIGEMADNIEHGRIQPPCRRVPGWLVRALLPALAADPTHRYPSMAALLRELRDRRPLRFVASAAIATIAAAGLFVTGGMFAAQRGGQSVGAGAPSRVGGPGLQLRAAEIPGVWDSDSRPKVEQAFRATQSARADLEWHRVSERLDDYAVALRSLQGRVNDSSSAQFWQLLQGPDPRIECLDLRKYNLNKVVRHLLEVDANAINHSIAIDDMLDPVEACAYSQGARPPSPQVQARVVELRKQDVELPLLLSTGKTADALAEGQRLVDEADKLGYRPLQAESRLTLGRLYWSHSRYSDAKDALVTAVANADAGGVPRVGVRALLELSWIEGEEQGHYTSAIGYAQMARGKLESVLGGDDKLRALLDDGEGMMRLYLNQLTKARPLLESARKLYLHAYGRNTHQEAASLEHLGLLAQAEHRFEDAAAWLKEAREIAERIHVPLHSATWTFRAEEAKALIQAGRYKDAIALNQRGRESFDENSELGVLFLSNQGLIERERKQYEQARGYLARALEIIERFHGPNHLAVADAATDLGLVLAELRRLPEAAQQLERAAEIYRRVRGSEPPDLAAALARLGRAHVAAGHLAAAK
jgi:serine/threonine protein kinase/tetratricopeptide (TPR) repeat protein